jgi:hypothetical protein
MGLDHHPSPPDNCSVDSTPNAKRDKSSGMDEVSLELRQIGPRQSAAIADIEPVTR